MFILSAMYSVCKL